jgi:hypothetical protein
MPFNIQKKLKMAKSYAYANAYEHRPIAPPETIYPLINNALVVCQDSNAG